MKYPCVEATIEAPCKGGHMRLWIERPTMLTLEEQEEIAAFAWTYERELADFIGAFVGVLIEKIPGLSAVQLCLQTGSEEMATQVGQVVYVKDFATDPHG